MNNPMSGRGPTDGTKRRREATARSSLTIRALDVDVRQIQAWAALRLCALNGERPLLTRRIDFESQRVIAWRCIGREHQPVAIVNRLIDDPIVYRAKAIAGLADTLAHHPARLIEQAQADQQLHGLGNFS